MKAKMIMVEGNSCALKMAQVSKIQNPKNSVFVAHGCNTKANMGGGFAHYLANLCPEVEFADKMMSPFMSLGKYSFTFDYSFKIIDGFFNLYTQLNGGSGTLAYHAIYESVINMTSNIIRLKRTGKVQIFMPFIGTGIAGGDANMCFVSIYDAMLDTMKENEKSDIELEIIIPTWGVQIKFDSDDLNSEGHQRTIADYQYLEFVK